MPSHASAHKSLGRRLEARLRSLRPFVDPRQLKAYRRVTAAHGSPRGDRPAVWCDFRSSEIDTVGGCHVYQIVRDLIAAGYEPVLRRSYRFLANLPIKAYKRLLVDAPFAIAAAEPDSPALTLTDHRPTAERSQAAHVALIDYAPRRAKADEIALPYCACPEVSETAIVPEIDPDAARPTGVFFAGSTDPNEYDRPVIRERFGMLTRREGLKALLGAGGLPRPIRLRSDADLALLDRSCPLGLAIDGGVYIPRTEWLKTLAKTDFWLALPGTKMPMCHNVIEALSVGAVPILEYDQHLTPALRDGVECFTFRGAEGLGHAVRRALATPEGLRRRMRAAALAYYQQHLAPGALTRRLLNTGNRQATLLINEHLAPRDQAASQLRLVA